MLKAIIFDFDGVLVDSEPLHYRAFVVAAKLIGFEMTYEDYLKIFIGYDDRDAFRVMIKGAPGAGDEEVEKKVAQLSQQKQEAFAQLVNQGASMIQGVWKLIDSVHGQMPLAIASGATREDIELILNHLGKRDLFETIVTADDVQRSKPDPKTYALAVENLAELHPELELKASECVALEDTAAGLTSARGAGLKTIGLMTSHSAEALSIADQVIEDTDSLNIAVLKQLF